MGTANSNVPYAVTGTSSVLEGGQMGESDESADVSDFYPLKVPHLFWHCHIFGGNANTVPFSLTCLLDDGSHLVLISEDTVRLLQLKRHHLKTPEFIKLALKSHEPKNVHELNKWVWLETCDLSSSWRVRRVRAVIAPRLCAPVILGLPFLCSNEIVIDHTKRSAINKKSGIDLLKSTVPPEPVNCTRTKVKRTH
jgi:hypothetical protein